MLPLILISQHEVQVEKYIDEFIQKHSVKPFYVFRLRPEKSELIIDQIRSVTKELIIQAESIRTFILYSFDTASIEAQNAFLKTLEEKQEKNQFILVAARINGILPTIRSRAVTIQLDAHAASVPIRDTTRKLLQSVTAGNTGFIGNGFIAGIARDESLIFFDECIAFYRESLRSGDARASEILKKILHIKGLLQYNNLNPQLAVDSLLISISKIHT